MAEYKIGDCLKHNHTGELAEIIDERQVNLDITAYCVKCLISGVEWYVENWALKRFWVLCPAAQLLYTNIVTRSTQ
jgi:hypothetical protein